MGALHLTPNAIPTQGPYLQRRAGARRALGGKARRRRLQDRHLLAGHHARQRAPLAAFRPARRHCRRAADLAAEEAAAPADRRGRLRRQIERLLDADDVGAEALLDTAAIMANLDLVVSIDCMPAHLAGALGRPVFIALPLCPTGAGCSSATTRPGIRPCGCSGRTPPGMGAGVRAHRRGGARAQGWSHKMPALHKTDDEGPYFVRGRHQFLRISGGCIWPRRTLP